MVYLARNFGKDKIFPLKKISQKEGISFDYLEKIISKLEKAGLIKAKKGAQGGYFLAKSPNKIRVGEIIRILEGEIFLVKCMAKKMKFICPRKKSCLTRSFWKKIKDSLNLTLDSLTLADLINVKEK